MSKLNKVNQNSKVNKRPIPEIRIKSFMSENQIVMELIGDSMAPSYQNGTKVGCEEVPAANWAYIHGGVYAVKCFNSLVVKRVNRKPRKGVIQLHSDNPSSGENFSYPLQSVSSIWKVLRIVDAPAI